MYKSCYLLYFYFIRNLSCIVSTESPGLFEAHVPVILNGNRDSPYRTLTLKGELLAPNLKFDPECLRLTPVPLGIQVSVNFNIIARGYRRQVKNTRHCCLLLWPMGGSLLQ